MSFQLSSHMKCSTTVVFFTNRFLNSFGLSFKDLRSLWKTTLFLFSLGAHLAANPFDLIAEAQNEMASSSHGVDIRISKSSHLPTKGIKCKLSFIHSG